MPNQHLISEESHPCPCTPAALTSPDIDCSAPLIINKRDTRSFLLHMLYALDAQNYEAPIEDVIEIFTKYYGVVIKDESVINMAHQIVATRALLDTTIEPLLCNWDFDRISVCTKLILRIATWELLNTELPAGIIINEAIELAKCFAEDDAYKFINGILDKIACQLGRNSKKASEDKESVRETATNP